METAAEYDYYDLNYSLSDDMYVTEPTVEVDLPLIIFIIMVLLSVIGNILVVLISVFSVRLRSLTSIFILNLALSDLLFTVGLVFNVCSLIPGPTFRDPICKVGCFMLSVGYYSSIAFLVLMTIQCYMAVVRPQTGWKKGRWVTHVLICVWTISMLASLPITVHTVARPDPGVCPYSNMTAFVAITSKENVIFVCAFSFMAFCFIRIRQTVFKSPPNQTRTVTGLTLLLVAVRFICWAPMNIVHFLQILIYYEIISYMHVLELFIAYICYFFAFSHSCLNPIIFGVFGIKYRMRVFKDEILKTSHDEGLGSL